MTNDQIHLLCEQYYITHYKINNDMSIDVSTGVDLSSIPIYNNIPVQFNKVHGSFLCGYSKLTTLQNCPKTVFGNFSCIYNQLTTLKEHPTYITGIFSSYGNNLSKRQPIIMSFIGGNIYSDNCWIF